jgi:predicted AAA+ superfamily ATPase
MKNLQFSTQEPFMKIISRVFSDVFKAWDDIKQRIEEKYTVFLDEVPPIQTRVNALKVMKRRERKTMN